MPFYVPNCSDVDHANELVAIVRMFHRTILNALHVRGSELSQPQVARQKGSANEGESRLLLEAVCPSTSGAWGFAHTAMLISE
jgi:hypothetical protein